MIGAIARAAAARVHALGVLDVPQPPNFASILQQLAQQFTSFMTSLLTTIDSTIVIIARLAYVTVLLLGILLYFTHAERRLGKDLIKGGIILAVLSEFVFPLISRI
ncbi:MAG TPA: hypothetical protein VLY21_03290 [Nitrososphaerales archaeon]|nr:hypothetical protein [Nitrososphaerales archaeon]